MTSLEKLQAGQNGDAAIIPQSQMTALDFPLMQDNVADQDDNATRFIIFKKQPASLVAPEATEAPDTAFKFPMFITPPTEQPGVLREILNHLADAGLNLVTIMSLPTRQKKLESIPFISKYQAPLTKRRPCLTPSVKWQRLTRCIH